MNNNNGRVDFDLPNLQALTKGDYNNVTNRLSAFYVCYKTNHFTSGEFPLAVYEGLVNKTTEKLPTFPELDPYGKPVLDANGNQVNTSIYSVTSIRITYFNIANAIQNLLNSFLTTLGVLIIATGLLLITNIQLMSVEDREFQTGVLRAVGENRPGISRIYLLETVFQGVLGGIFGLVGGLIFGWTVAYYLSNLFGTGAGTVAPVVSVSLVIFSVVLGVIIAILTGLLPAIRASRVNIVEALRGIKLLIEENSSRYYIAIGIVIFIIGIFFLLYNGVYNTNYQPFWESAGWNTIVEQQTILLALGLIVTGMGTILTRFIDRIKAINITAILLWATPVTAYVYTLQWVSTGTNGPISDTTDFLLITITEIVIGSVLLIGLNLNFIMGVLRRFLINFNIFKGVGQISPAMIKSHKTRSTLTFAIFAVVLTLNVTIASLVATQTNSTIGKANSDSRGVDIAVTLSSPENTSFSYAFLVKNLDPNIKDVIPFRSCSDCGGKNNPFYVYINNPELPTFDKNSQQAHLRLVEVTPQQIRGNATNYKNPNWRYDLYLAGNGYPDQIRSQYNSKMSDPKLLDLSRQSWDYLFNYSYEMAAYNLSIKTIGFRSGGNSLEGKTKLLNANGSIIINPIVFTDSPLLRLGQEIWIQMNTTLINNKPVVVYQSFTIGGIIDRERAAGFPFSSRFGSIFMTQYWTNMTDFFGLANTTGVAKQDLHQYNDFAVKTTYPINDPNILKIAQHIEDFTNSNKSYSYRTLTHNKFIRASSVTIWSEIQSNLQALDQITNFLQIYVSFGLIIGSLGMAVIAIRNVAERKREIGMMRAIGFPRGQVMLSVLLELFVLGTIGLIIGVSNGLVINYGLATLANNTSVIPWDTIAIYLGFIAFVAFLAGALPGWVAARVPASDALRYTG